MVYFTNTGGPLDTLSVAYGDDNFLRRTNLSILHSPSSILASTAYGFDAASRLQTVTDGNNDSATYSYLANSPLVSQISFKQGTTTRMTTTKAYDFLNRLTQVSSVPSASSAVNFNYSYNSANQRIQDKLADGSYWVYQYVKTAKHDKYRDGASANDLNQRQFLGCRDGLARFRPSDGSNFNKPP